MSDEICEVEACFEKVHAFSHKYCPEHWAHDKPKEKLEPNRPEESHLAKYIREAIPKEEETVTTAQLIDLALHLIDDEVVSAVKKELIRRIENGS